MSVYVAYFLFTVLMCLQLLFVEAGVQNEPGHCEVEHDTNTLECTYIPSMIDNGITRVRIVNPKDKWHGLAVVSNKNFTDESWRTVTCLEFHYEEKWHVEFHNASFVNLLSLKELHIKIENDFVLPSDTFVELDNVTTLNMSGCLKGDTKLLQAALNGPRKLPSLQKLVLSSWGNSKDYFTIDEKFVEALLPRNITYIDISNTELANINATAVCQKLKHLEFLNVSLAVLDEVEHENLAQKDLEHFKMFDVSKAALPKKTFPFIPGPVIVKNRVYNLTSSNDSSRDKGINLLLMPETVNFTELVPSTSSFELKNVTLVSSNELGWMIKHLVFQRNNLKYVDVKFECNDTAISGIESIDLTGNRLEFLEPLFFQCFPNITELVLSNNNLDQMLSHNKTSFEDLLSQLESLRYVTLSTNNLWMIPKRFFSSSSYIERIDLSVNRLTQITFSMNNLGNLKVLNLAHNQIKILDSQSLGHLDSIPRISREQHQVTVILQRNPISCSECRTKHFIEWLMTTNLVNINEQKLNCSVTTQKWVQISDSILKNVEKICNRKKIVISLATLSIVLSVAAFVVAIVYYRIRRRAKILQNRTNVINRLREGNGQYEFVVFLSHSSDDEDFVARNIQAQLNENLQLMTGIERNLVCTGDEHLRCGFQIQEETWKCLDRASVVMVIVSESFCSSGYCRVELDQAYIKRKPVLLMFIEHVDEDAMMPTMKELYRKNVRILWTKQNGQMVMKSSWEKVCKSILDIVQSH